MSNTILTPPEWQPWSTVPKDGTPVFSLCCTGQVWISVWQADDLPVPDGFVGLMRDEMTVGWRPIPDDIRARLEAEYPALSAGEGETK